jgi:hypothetical protein
MITRNRMDGMLLDATRAALEEVGTTALDLLRQYPGVSLQELPNYLTSSVSSHGLILAVYDEARTTGQIREVSYELLLRSILAAYPKGWPASHRARPYLMLAGWMEGMEKALGAAYFARAQAVLKELAFVRRPPPGWRPSYPADDYVWTIFELCWVG